MDQTWCTGMNVHGDIDIVGQYQDAGKKTHGFLRTRMGKVISLDFPDATTTSAWKVNDAGVVVGYYWDNATPSVSHGFVWLDGVFIQKDYPGAVHNHDSRLQLGWRVLRNGELYPASNNARMGRVSPVPGEAAAGC